MINMSETDSVIYVHNAVVILNKFVTMATEFCDKALIVTDISGNKND